MWICYRGRTCHMIPVEPSVTILIMYDKSDGTQPSATNDLLLCYVPLEFNHNYNCIFAKRSYRVLIRVCVCVCVCVFAR